VNSRPSLTIVNEIEVSPGVVEEELCLLDQHIKTAVAHDAIKLARKKTYDNVDRQGTYRKLLPQGSDYEFCGEIFNRARGCFTKLTSVRNPKTIQNGAWVKLIRDFKKAGVDVSGVQQFDFDNVYRLSMRKMEQPSFDFLPFMCAV